MLVHRSRSHSVILLAALGLMLLPGCRRLAQPAKDASQSGGKQSTAKQPQDSVPGKVSLTAEEARRKADQLVALAASADDPDFAKIGMPIVNDLNQSKQAELAVPGLVEKLKDEDMPRRRMAAKILRLIGTPAQKAIPALLDALKDPSSDVRQEVIVALGRICWSKTPPQPPETPKVVKALLPSLEDGTGTADDRNINRLHALQALGNIGPAAAEAIPRIIPLLDDPQDSARSNAASAIGSIGSADKAVPILLRLARSDSSQEVRRNADHALLKLKAR